MRFYYSKGIPYKDGSAGSSPVPPTEKSSGFTHNLKNFLVINSLDLAVYLKKIKCLIYRTFFAATMRRLAYPPEIISSSQVIRISASSKEPAI